MQIKAGGTSRETLMQRGHLWAPPPSLTFFIFAQTHWIFSVKSIWQHGTIYLIWSNSLFAQLPLWCVSCARAHTHTHAEHCAVCHVHWQDRDSLVDETCRGLQRRSIFIDAKQNMRLCWDIGHHCNFRVQKQMTQTDRAGSAAVEEVKYIKVTV